LFYSDLIENDLRPVGPDRIYFCLFDDKVSYLL
jgi:hypothetical protein